MTDDEQDMLDKIRGKNLFRFTDEKLTYKALCLLLKHDETVQALITALFVTNPALGVAETTSQTAIQQANTPAPKKAGNAKEKPDPLRASLSKQLEMLTILEGDEELSVQWLGQTLKPEQTPLVKMIAIAANWERILELWDIIAARCRNENRVISTDEQNLLTGAVAIHNNIWQGNGATFVNVNIGEKYDFQKHTRSTNTGEIIQLELLPGVCNAAGEATRKPIVSTKST